MQENDTPRGVGRRDLLALGLALPAAAASPAATQAKQSLTTRPDRRRLGTLEVSSVGLGVQNMTRTYQTTIPSRPEMQRIIRAAYDNGITFFDAAEAYGPHEVERVLGEAVASFRDEVVICSKFGWNIDQEADPAARPRRASGDRGAERIFHALARP